MTGDLGTYLWALRAVGAATVAVGVALLAATPRARRLGLAPLLPGLGLLAWRTIQVGHLPLAGLHETLLTFGVCLTLASSIPLCALGTHRIHGLCLGGTGLLWVLSSLASPAPTPLVPALQTLWFEVHVASSFAAYGCFGLAAAGGAVFLAGEHRLAARLVFEGANRWGFAWFTWAMVSGGVWAYLAWGAYWLWHVKELWSGVIWIFYAGALHLPLLPRWRDRPQAALSLIGFGLVLFTYVGVGLLMRNTHQF